ncbi:SDR family NAD(P)-dependent oxidoreductase [Nostoc sp. 'Lobaria pulmonaria (5183) cyanobiont']|uniref:SDR family NAD(P)-dependent oxidoreductase n=1 Tax=Nostoc sp. 'Lobaria pulmonaria (5183) cyanobiont' TaxID=1618022 RepID=UPI000CF32EFA|nr:SDR family oxidoreductase [Nostoc sp. 'Lobaria pulmonaria (5183) cyanobiont']AVH69497.1 3-oxoacyl-(acyl-carrier-protein) reductase [Nostoc sp. 'Lobaria pulmonaria (5183) cyanobiont']
MDLGLKDKVAVITGGDSGIGKATAKLLAREGAKVTIIDKTSESLQLAAEELRKSGEIFTLQADLTQPKEVEAAKKQIIERFGTVHILVHAAGITGATGDFLELSDEEWYKTIEVDLMAAVRTCRAFIGAMRQTGWGRVILISSEDALQPYPEEMPYCACKAAVLNLAKNLSKAYAKDGVLVNAVSPAYIATPMTDAMMEKRSKQLGVSFDQAIDSFLDEQRPHIELKRRGKAEEVAAVIAFLCSEQSSFVVGSNYRVDGGSVASL